MLEACLMKSMLSECVAWQISFEVGIAFVCFISPFTYNMEPLRLVRYPVTDGLDSASLVAFKEDKGTPELLGDVGYQFPCGNFDLHAKGNGGPAPVFEFGWRSVSLERCSLSNAVSMIRLGACARCRAIIFSEVACTFHTLVLYGSGITYTRSRPSHPSLDPRLSFLFKASCESNLCRTLCGWIVKLDVFMSRA